ncbi:hypothetical protein AKJ41_03245 [candidate division MSBL1 archaeon SCGC-AAA259O05]|uniref:Glucokinase n=1 Tax=candidate division MSBL1 archaeon SCGC-AAA259O05 TaxID=1698271 RepID=A0A133V3F2_9EURY|nr:hypothetical protein AKJ41_03245 [candidate division MSBL1 archaeon SCGC-AAA259O05]
MSESLAVGVDIGGTNLRGVIANEAGEFLFREKEKINTKDKKGISRQIIKLVDDFCESAKIEVNDLKGIGIASTGPMKRKEGVLIEPTNIPFDEVPLKEPIEKKIDIPVSLINDCIAGVLGEKEYGIGSERNVENLVYVTMGTGIGGGAIVDNHLLIGEGGNAAEIGHFTVDPEERLECGCGKKGHWEAYCSGKNIPNYLRLRFSEIGDERVQNSLLHDLVSGDYSEIDAKLFFDAVRKEDELANQIAEEIGNLNAIGFSNVIDAYAPSLITVGGSVALKNEKIVLPPVQKQVKNHIRNIEPEIAITPLKEDVGLYGAVAEAFTSPNQSESRYL